MSDCGACIGGGDFDGYIQMFEQDVVKVRKDHQCTECRRIIPRGSICQRTSGKWEGKWLAEHTCMDCVNIGEGLSCGEPRSLGTLWEDVCEAVFPVMTTGCLQKIETASAKAYLLERWRAWKGIE